MKTKPQFRIISAALMLFVALVGLAACASQPAVSIPTLAPAPATAISQGPSTATPGVAVTGTTQASSSGATTGAAVSFSKDVLPIFENSCISCHGGEKTSKALDMKTYASLMTGSQNGAVIAPNDAAKSKLIQSVQSGKMPKRGDKLTAAQVKLLVDWVNAGAANN